MNDAPFATVAELQAWLLATGADQGNSLASGHKERGEQHWGYEAFACRTCRRPTIRAKRVEGTHLTCGAYKCE